MLVLGFDDYRPQGERLAEALELPFDTVKLHRFPDGESKLTLPENLPREVIVCRSLDHPNDKLVEMLLLAKTARQMGVTRLTLIAPYLCYMRQDIAFHPGEAVSQRLVGAYLAELFDAVYTVDAHLHRIDSLDQALPGITAINLYAAPLMTQFLGQRNPGTIVVGPDAESQQWVRAIAVPAGLDFAVATKERFGDREVRIHLPQREYDGREVVLVDDMASTGRTLMGVTAALKQAGVGAIHCLVTHALFADEVTEQLHQAGIDHIWSTDSIEHESNALHLAPLLAEAIRSH